MRRRWPLIILALLVSATVLEAGSRVYQRWFRHQTIEDSIFTPCYRHYFLLGPSFKPDARCSWQGVPELRINSMGFRGREVPLHKGAGILRIITFGGSTSHAGDYPRKLEAVLRRQPPGGYKDVEVINAAVPTWTTTQNLVQFISRAVYLHPDIVIFYEAINAVHMSDFYWLYNLPQVRYTEHGGTLQNHLQFYNCAFRSS